MADGDRTTSHAKSLSDFVWAENALDRQALVKPEFNRRAAAPDPSLRMDKTIAERGQAEPAGSPMVRADAPALNLNPRGMTREAPDRQAYNTRLAIERYRAAAQNIRAREGHERERDRERGR